MKPAQSIILRYIDAPGRMGVIGTILGQAGINITTMQIGKREGCESAVVYLNIEGEVAEELVEELRAAIPDLENLWFVRL